MIHFDSIWILALQTVEHPAVWPITVAGWVTLVTAVALAVGGLVAGGKFLAILNGYGGRLGNVEEAQDESRGHRVAMQRQIDRILDQHEGMIGRLGESKRSAEKYNEETVDLGIQIGTKIDTLGREVNIMNLHLSQRIKAVETVLKLKGE